MHDSYKRYGTQSVKRLKLAKHLNDLTWKHHKGKVEPIEPTLIDELAFLLMDGVYTATQAAECIDVNPSHIYDMIASIEAKGLPVRLRILTNGKSAYTI